jgi:hypothetical protein
MQKSIAILTLCFIWSAAPGQRFQKFKLISSFDSKIENDLFVYELNGGLLKFVRDTFDVVTVFLPNRKTVHVKIFSPAHGIFEAKLKKVDTSTIIAFLNAQCPIDPSTAALDTLNGTPKILAATGYLPCGLTFNDRDFERLFDVKILDYGDVSPCVNCMTYYNRVVFQYLDHKYAGIWRKFVVSRPPGY